uniref:Uncharacterized protein n=1 Tax=viral metagenome TaxID=1070528 RepID=A0A6C0BR29_9ZZZZ
MDIKQIDALLAENPGLKQAKIRVDTKTQKASVIDVIKWVTGQTSSNSQNTFRRLGADLGAGCTQLRINGKGRLTPVADAPTLVEIIWELPGKAAKRFRRQSAHWVCRILGGDLRLAQEIEKRYLETSQDAKTFFLQNADQGPALGDDHERKLALRERELALERQAMEIEAMRAQNNLKMAESKLKMAEAEERRVAVYQKKSEMEKAILEDVKETFETWNLDERDQAWLKDVVRISNKRKLTQMLGTDPEGEKAPDMPERPRETISIPLVCAQLGLRAKGQESRIGKLMVRLWRQKHGKGPGDNPMKRRSIYQGREILVNSYFEDDRDIMEAAIQHVLGN